MAHGDPYAALPPPIQAIARDSFRADQRGTIVSGAVVATIGLGLAIFVFGYAASHGRALMPRGEELLPILGGLAVAGLGAWILSKAFRPDPFLAAMSQPHGTVQEIRVETSFGPKSGHTVWLRFVFRAGVDGALVLVRNTSRGEAEAALERARATMASLAPYFPSARLG
jgi:hypothetical protein